MAIVATQGNITLENRIFMEGETNLINGVSNSELYFNNTVIYDS